MQNTRNGILTICLSCRHLFLRLKPDCKDIFKKIKSLALQQDVNTIYNNGDSDAEGQCLIQEILNAIHNKKPVLRIWNSSMDANDIRQAVRDAKPDSQYKNLLLSAEARADLDWLYGMNLSRLMSIRGNAVLPVGRVQTPVLALICRRAEEVEHFKAIPYYEVAVMDNNTGIVLIYCDEEGKVPFKTETEANTLCTAIRGKIGKVTSVTKIRKKVTKPLIYTTSDLETDANQIFHIAPSDTLAALETLYMTGITSYPRTDCPYLFQNMEQDFNLRINEISAQYPSTKKYVQMMKQKGLENSYIYNDAKVDEHTGIILISGFKSCNIPSLSEIQQKILLLIAKRMLTVCAPNPLYDKLTISAEIEGKTFSATETSAVSNGFLIFDQILLGRQAKTSKTLPNIKTGDLYCADSTESIKRVPKCPQYYTPGEMIKLMANIAREAPVQYKKVLKDCEGLGTGATRDAIISNLLKVHGKGEAMCAVKKNRLVPTATGRYLISIISDEMKSPVMTAQMETSLDNIRKGKTQATTFLTDTKKHLADIVATGKTASIVPMNPASRTGGKVVGKCPRCGKDVVETPKTYSCCGYQTKSCDFAIYKMPGLFVSQKKHLTAAMVSSLLKKGQSM